ncbi:MAG TPA: hypothetical protein EYG47_02615, partial [Cycloclasticus sp.]|nr:hypothetical protein [Cycloclasticus sp.]
MFRKIIFTLFLFSIAGYMPSVLAVKKADTGTNPFSDNPITDVRVEGLIKEIFPNATRIDSKDPEKKVWPIYVAFQQVGYAFESQDFIRIQGFAGDIINLLIGIDN